MSKTSTEKASANQLVAASSSIISSMQATSNGLAPRTSCRDEVARAPLIVEALDKSRCSFRDAPPDAGAGLGQETMRAQRLLRTAPFNLRRPFFFVDGDKRLAAAMDCPAKCLGYIDVCLQPGAGLIENQDRWRDRFRARRPHARAGDGASQRQSCQPVHRTPGHWPWLVS